MPRCRINGISIGEGQPVRVMGVINCSPESFYSGSFAGFGEIRARAESMSDQGADIIDIGARSTAPSSPPIDEKTEAERMEKALSELDGSGITVSVDTIRSSVLERCLAHDIHAINDIGGLAIREYAELVAGSGLPAVLMASHRLPGDSLSLSATMDALSLVVSRCEESGITEYVLDPGIGKWIPGRTAATDWELCRHFHEFQSFSRPILAAVSRKSFLGEVVGREAAGRLPASLALTAMLIERGADMVRTHDVDATVDVVRVVEAMEGVR